MPPISNTPVDLVVDPGTSQDTNPAPGPTPDTGSNTPSDQEPNTKPNAEQKVSNTMTDLSFTTFRPGKIMVEWRTSLMSRGRINFGESNSLSEFVENKELTMEHRLELPQAKIKAGKQYHYQIVSTVDGEEIKSVVKSFIAPGYTVNIRVIDSAKKPIVGAVVKLGENSATTDKNGVAKFSNVADGQNTAKVQVDKSSQISNIQVQKSTSAVQEFEIIAKTSTGMDWMTIVITVVVVLAIIGAGAFLFIKNKQSGNSNFIGG